ncbi:phage major capsid family protein [Paenibacillus amylolyticus]|uniref:phage major capsid family protein n=1 Tax=Paenibacillus amylolyticus TaxID=1451 RepID=UPI003F7CD3E1
MRNNGQIANNSIRKGTIHTGLDPAAMNYEEVDAFLQMAYESTEFLKGIRTETRDSSKGTIDKIGVTGRNLRKKREGNPAGKQTEPVYQQVPYSVVPVTLQYEITEEKIRMEQRVRKQNIEEIIMGGMTRNFGENMQDLGFNGDMSTLANDPDYDFLSIADGWLKKARNTGNFTDWSTLDAAGKLGIFFRLERSVPTRLRSAGQFKYFMHPNTFSERLEQLALKDTSASIQIQILGAQKRINNYDVEEVPHMPEGSVLFTYKPNFVIVNTYDMIIRKTTEGKAAVTEDKRFYATHADGDFIFEEPGAVAMAEGVQF